MALIEGLNCAELHPCDGRCSDSVHSGGRSMATDTKPIICTCACGCRNDCAPFKIPLCYDCGISGACEALSKEKGYRQEPEE